MKKILNKILEEINKSEPRLDYVRGLIEASVEEETSIIGATNTDKVPIKEIKIPQEVIIDTELPPFNPKNVIKDSLEEMK